MILFSALVFLWTLVLSAALPYNLDRTEESTPFWSPEKKPEPEIYGTGFAIGGTQSFQFGMKYPDGSGGALGYQHAPLYGHDISVDAMVPVWSRKNKYGETTLNLGGGLTQHIGGLSGSGLTDKRIELGLVHTFG